MYLTSGLTEEEHREADLAIRKELLELRRQELASSKSDRFWTIMASVATIGIPIITFLGVSAWFRLGSGKSRR